MGALQTIRTEAGEELVVLSRRDYDALRAQADEREAEDRMSEHIVAAAHAAALISTVQPLPLEVWETLERPETRTLGDRLKVLRQARGLTLPQLAQAAGLDAGVISAVEEGRDLEARAPVGRLAQVLAVDYETLAAPSGGADDPPCLPVS